MKNMVKNENCLPSSLDTNDEIVKHSTKKEKNLMAVVLLLELEVGSNLLSDVEPFNIGRIDHQCPHIAPT